ncbi:MAG: response regulator [Bdellovibrionales bacterium]|nr:response regulator [Bdellovibrionales bacterium]
MELPFSQAYRQIRWKQYRVLLACVAFGVSWVLLTEHFMTPESVGSGAYEWLLRNNHWVLIGLTSVLAYVFVRHQRKQHSRIEHLLAHDAKRFHALIQNVPSLVFVTDLRANISYINRVNIPLPIEEVIGRNVFDFAHKNDQETIRNAIRKAIETGGPVNYEAGNPEGAPSAWYNVQIQPLMSGGKVQSLAFFCTDITGRKHIEDALRESEARYRDVASNIPNMMVYQFVLTAEGRYQMPFVSSRVQDLFEVSPEQAQANVEVLLKMVHEEDNDLFFKSIALSARNLSIWSHEFRTVLKSGKIRWIRGTSTPRLMQNGDILWNGILVDITQEREDKLQRKQLERQLQQAQKLEALGTLASGVAHDFNNYLQMITMSVELAQQHMYNAEVAQSYLERALATASGGRHLIRQILTFARNEEVESKPIDLSASMNDFLQMIRATAPTTTQFNYEIEPKLFVRGNMTQIHQVLINLCTNAFYALKDRPGGRIQVRLAKAFVCECSKPSPIPAGEYAELIVQDDGKGMTPEQVDRVFEPFYTTKPVGQGTGLGLSVVHGIVRSHQGHIEVKSSVDEGTSFRVLFPISEVRERTHDQVVANPNHGRGQKVLVVEDETELLELESSMLEGLGFEVFRAPDGTQALQLFSELGFQLDLVISDNSLPGITGLELFREMRKVNQSIPLILASGLDERKVREQESQVDVTVDRFLAKPFTSQELGDVLHSVLPSRPNHPR